MDEQRLAELEELANARTLTTAEQRELDELRADTQIVLTLYRVTPVVTKLTLHNNVTGEVHEWTPDSDEWTNPN
jgi:hypothetical protein